MKLGLFESTIERKTLQSMENNFLDCTASQIALCVNQKRLEKGHLWLETCQQPVHEQQPVHMNLLDNKTDKITMM